MDQVRVEEVCIILTVLNGSIKLSGPEVRPDYGSIRRETNAYMLVCVLHHNAHERLKPSGPHYNDHTEMLSTLWVITYTPSEQPEQIRRTQTPITYKWMRGRHHTVQQARKSLWYNNVYVTTSSSFKLEECVTHWEAHARSPCFIFQNPATRILI